MINERKSSASSITVYLCGIKFFYETTLKRTLPIFDLVRPLRTKKLPVVLSSEEVHLILKGIENPIYRMALTIIYACGLRISEAVRLTVGDINGTRHLPRVRNGKGGKDRYIHLADRPLGLLRDYCRRRVNHAGFLFPHNKSHVQPAPRPASKQTGQALVVAREKRSVDGRKNGENKQARFLAVCAVPRGPHFTYAETEQGFHSTHHKNRSGIHTTINHEG